MEEIREIKGRKCSIPKESAHIKATGIQQLAFPYLHKATEIGKTFLPAIVHQVTHQRVDNDIDTMTIRGSQYGGNKGRITRAEDVIRINSKLIDQIVALGWRAARCVDLSTN